MSAWRDDACRVGHYVGGRLVLDPAASAQDVFTRRLRHESDDCGHFRPVVLGLQ